MFFIVRFIVFWAVWLLVADKKRWKELFPVAFFAALLGQFSDQAFMKFYKLWEYHEPHDTGPIYSFFLEVLNDLSVYMVVTYLFIQWLPNNRTAWNMFRYWFSWTVFAIMVELIHIKTGHMTYHQWWNLGYSYLADWILFWVFYQFHKRFKLHLLGMGIDRFDGILFVLDCEGRVTKCHSIWLEQRGINPQCGIGMKIQDFQGTDQHVWDTHEQAYKRVLNGECVTFQWNWDFPNKKTYMMETMLSPLRDSEGNIVGMIGWDYEINTVKNNQVNPLLQRTTFDRYL